VLAAFTAIAFTVSIVLCQGAHLQAFPSLPSLFPLLIIILFSVTGNWGSWLGFGSHWNSLHLRANGGSSWMSQAPNLQLVMQFKVNCMYTCMYMYVPIHAVYKTMYLVHLSTLNKFNLYLTFEVDV